jgi:hypothetical protein
MSDLLDRATRFATLMDRKKHLKDELEVVMREMEELEGPLIMEMGEAGLKKLTVTAGIDDYGNPKFRTVSPKRTLWAGAVEGDKMRLIEVLKNSPYADFVSETYNTNTLSSVVREINRDAGGRLSVDEIKERLPDYLKGVLEVSEKIQLGATKA